MNLPYKNYAYTYAFQQILLVQNLLTTTELIRSLDFKYVLINKINFFQSSKTQLFNPLTKKCVTFFDDLEDLSKYTTYANDLINHVNNKYNEKLNTISTPIFINDTTTLDILKKETHNLSSHNSIVLSKNVYLRLINHLSFHRQELFKSNFYSRNFLTNCIDTPVNFDLNLFQKTITSFLANDPEFSLKDSTVSDLIYENASGRVLTLSHPISSFDSLGVSEYDISDFSHIEEHNFRQVAIKNNGIFFRRLIENYFHHYQYKNTHKDYLSNIPFLAPYQINAEVLQKSLVHALFTFKPMNISASTAIKTVKKQIIFQTLSTTSSEDTIIEHFKALNQTKAYTDKEIGNQFISYINEIHKKKNRNKLAVNPSLVMTKIIKELTSQQRQVILELNNKLNTSIVGLADLIHKLENGSTDEYLNKLINDDGLFLNSPTEEVISFDINTDKLNKLFASSLSSAEIANRLFFQFSHVFNCKMSFTNMKSKEHENFSRIMLRFENNEYKLTQNDLRLFFIQSLDKFSKLELSKPASTEFFHNLSHEELLLRKLKLHDKKEIEVPKIKKKL